MDGVGGPKSSPGHTPALAGAYHHEVQTLRYTTLLKLVHKTAHKHACIESVDIPYADAARGGVLAEDDKLLPRPLGQERSHRLGKTYQLQSKPISCIKSNFWGWGLSVWLLCCRSSGTCEVGGSARCLALTGWVNAQHAHVPGKETH